MSRFVRAKPPAVDRALDPVDVVAYEGSFDVFEVEERDDDVLVVVGGSGLRMTLRFEALEAGVRYEQVDDAGPPLESMETELTYAPRDEGTLVTAVSSVSLGLRPRAVTDRIAAWKRRAELSRCLSALAERVE